MVVWGVRGCFEALIGGEQGGRGLPGTFCWTADALKLDIEHRYPAVFAFGKRTSDFCTFDMGSFDWECIFACSKFLMPCMPNRVCWQDAWTKKHSDSKTTQFRQTPVPWPWLGQPLVSNNIMLVSLQRWPGAVCLTKSFHRPR